MDRQLLLACQKGRGEEVKQLLKSTRININVKDETMYNFGETPLMYACANGRIEIVETLLKDKRLNINISDSLGRTAFFHVCRGGEVEIANLLLKEEKLDINIQSDGKTPLFLACNFGQYEILRLILAYRSINEVNIKFKNQKGETLIEVAREASQQRKKSWENFEHYLVKKTLFLDIIKLLESYSNDPNGTRCELRKQLGLAGIFFVFLFFILSFFFLSFFLFFF